MQAPLQELAKLSAATTVVLAPTQHMAGFRWQQCCSCRSASAAASCCSAIHPPHKTFDNGAGLSTCTHAQNAHGISKHGGQRTHMLYMTTACYMCSAEPRPGEAATGARQQHINSQTSRRRMTAVHSYAALCNAADDAAATNCNLSGKNNAELHLSLSLYRCMHQMKQQHLTKHAAQRSARHSRRASHNLAELYSAAAAAQTHQTCCSAQLTAALAAARLVCLGRLHEHMERGCSAVPTGA